MMHLRWVVRIKKITAGIIKQYQDDHGCGVEEAKHNLRQQNQKEKVLQYFDDETKTWKDVPTVFEVSFIGEES